MAVKGSAKFFEEIDIEGFSDPKIVMGATDFLNA
jgi:hypothetical protein